ncbi:hypothetical protein JI739_19555 [Ramlibacter sp. AW1]|uniref:Secreted protein n=1 Tax=Ramlibacter aurantiacus TaxID=2801330 RepID=A0A936ZMM3_9BURK|nr:hypothetical protein [Ramlibacter aurantiacus]MBL0422552.1 hypothetical protein [Ramlibacter aurantiacus]
MKPGRRYRIFTVIFSLCMLLFAQGVLAGYFCQQAATSVDASAATATATATDCTVTMSSSDEQDRELCHAHCQSGSQTADSYQPAAPQDVRELSDALTVELAPAERTERSGPQPNLLRRSSAPSIALQHCCLRT